MSVAHLYMPSFAERVYGPLAVNRASAGATDRDTALIMTAKTVELAGLLAGIYRQFLPVSAHNSANSSHLGVYEISPLKPSLGGYTSKRGDLTHSLCS